MTEIKCMKFSTEDVYKMVKYYLIKSCNMSEKEIIDIGFMNEGSYVLTVYTETGEPSDCQLCFYDGGSVCWKNGKWGRLCKEFREKR